MSLLNSTVLQNLLVDNLYIQNQLINTNQVMIGNVLTTALTTEVIINDFTKNQVLFEEIYGNIHGNTFPQLQAEIDAIEANVAILQAQDVSLQNQINVINGNIASLEAEDVNLQSQINLLSGNVVINANAIAELINDTQFLEAPYAGLVGNTSYFINGLQMWSGADENGNGLFVYKDGGSAGLNQIRMGVEDDKSILIAGGSQSLQPKSTGNVNVNNTNGNFSFLVGDRTKTNFQNLSKTEINGAIDLKGEGSTAISIYTQPAQSIPLPIPAIKRCDMRGDDETRLFGKQISATDDDGGKITLSKSVSIFTPGGSSPGQIDLQVGSCDINTTGKINIGTTQGLTEAGFKEIYIGQNGPPSAARKSSTLLDGDTYLPQNLVLNPNPGFWDNITYIGLPTTYSGPLRGPLKSTYTPYVKSISTFFQGPTINSFVSLAGTFSVLVGVGAITMAAGAGGVAISSGIGAIGLTTAGGAIGLTTAGGACQITTGAGAINMTTGIGVIQMETNNGDVIIQPGNAPGGVGGSAYLKPKDYLILNPDEQVIIGQDGNLPVYGALIDTSNYQFNGTLFLVGNVINSNVFQTQAIDTYLTGASFGYISWVGNDLVANTYGNATMDIVNYDNNTVITSSGVSPINPNTYGTFSFGNSEVLLPSNANLIAKIYPQGNLVNYQYKTWQSNANIAGNVGVIINAVVRPNNINTTHFVNVFGNVFFNDELDTYSNITLKNQVNQNTTIITDDSIFTTGDITAQNFYGNSHQVSGNITGDYFLGNGMILSGTGKAQFFEATTAVILDPQGSPITNPANALSNSGGQLYFNGNVIAGGGVGGVSQIIAGNGIEISPLIGTGNVTVSLAGSVIPPGGYLPISGGTMTGSIYQFPSSNLVASNTIKKYRPLTSYQPPFPSISTPSFTGEQLTFFNGDNSPEQLNFTGWFPENMFQYQPDVITGNIPGGQNTFYSFAGGTNQLITGGSFNTHLNQFANGDHITGGSITIVSADADQTKLTLSIFSQDPGGAYNTLYQIAIPSLPTGGGTYSIPIDYTYTGGQTGQNLIVFSFDPLDAFGNYPHFTIVGSPIGGTQYDFQGQLNLEGVGQSSHYIGVQGDPTTSIFYEYFPTTNLISKLGGVFKTGGVGKINGIYADDVATSRQIIVYGDFNTLITSGQQTLTFVFNNIFMYNVDTGIYSQLTTQTADPAYAGNLPKGLNGAVYGVEKQTSQTSIRNVWIWGDFTNVAQMGNPLPPTDSTVSCGINYTQTDNWGLPISWGTTNPNNSLNGCRGGSIANDNPASPQSFALMVWATTRDGGNYRTISIAYYDTGNISATTYPFGNGNFGNPAITTNVVSRIDKVDWRTGPSTVFKQLVFCGSYIGVAQGGGNVDVPCYSLSSTQTTDNGWNPGFNPPWGQGLKILADSGNATLWYPNSILMGSYTYSVCTNGTINETAVIGTTGYSSLSTNGGGVMTMNNNDFFVSSPTVNQFLITGVPKYSVKNIIGIDPTALQLSCGLDEDNFWWGQTFNSTISPAPIPPTQPTVNAINGARFLVNNVEMDKIVFSGGDTDFSSVSFIAGSVEKGDPYWYWQSQVGALDYYDGATFYPNITSSPPQPYVPGLTTSTLGQVMINGAIASVNLNMYNHDIINANTIYSQNILTLSAPNAVEVGVGSRRVLPTLTIILNTLGNDGESDFGAFNYVDSIEFAITATSIFQKNSLQGYFRYDDGFGGGSGYLTPSIIAVSGGGVIATGNQTLISSSSGQDWSFSFPNDVTLTAGNSYFFKFTTDGSSSSYYFYGWKTAIPQSVCSYAEAMVYQSVNDPLDFFNVYGNSFYSDRITTYGDIFLDNPATSLGANVLIDDTQILLNDNQNNLQITPIYVKVANSAFATIYSQLEYNVLSMYNSAYSKLAQMYSDGFTLIQTPSGFSNTNYITIDGYRCTYTQNSIYSGQAQLVSTSGGSQVFLSSSQLSGVSVGYSMTLESAVSSNFRLACSTLGGPGGQKQLDISNTGAINIQTTNNSLITLVNSTTQLTLNAAVSTLMGSTVTMKTPSDNNNFIVSTASQFHNSADVDDINNPTLQIVNNNVSTASYPVVKFNKSTTSTQVGNVISAVSSWARDYTNTSLEWSRIQTKVENNSVGNQDATLSIFTIVNGTLSEVFNFNGGQNEINSFRPLDLNGNDLRSTTGNVIINSNISTGTGQVLIQTKGGTAGSGAGIVISGNTMTSTSAGGSSGHHMCITLPDPTTGLPRVYKIALLNP
jgi:hypothetical protein